MAKRKNTKELLAERNPLQRVFVEPVDIYEQDAEASGQGSEAAAASKRRDAAAPKAVQKNKAKSADDPLRPYSTYLRRSQVKNIKRHAVEREVKDMLIMQEAVDEYLKRHTL